MIDYVVRFVDVMDGAIPQAAHGWIVFLACDVIVRSIQQFQRAVVAAGAVHSGIDRRMVVQILSIPNGSLLDFVDGFVDLLNGVFFFLVHVMRGRQVLQMGAGMAQVGEGMQVRRMPSWFVGESEGSADSDKKHDYGTVSYSFHSLLDAFRQNRTSLVVNPELRILTRPILLSVAGRRKLRWYRAVMAL
jgi:hypothetical protein